MAYQHTNAQGRKYFLHGKSVRLRSGRNQQIYYFAKEVRPEALDQLPAGFVVVENKRTGLPVLKRA